MGEDINSSIINRSHLGGGTVISNHSKMNEFTDASLEAVNVSVN
jgi:hypothetical protein